MLSISINNINLINLSSFEQVFFQPVDFNNIAYTHFLFAFSLFFIGLFAIVIKNWQIPLIHKSYRFFFFSVLFIRWFYQQLPIAIFIVPHCYRVVLLIDLKGLDGVTFLLSIIFFAYRLKKIEHVLGFVVLGMIQYTNTGIPTGEDPPMHPNFWIEGVDDRLANIQYSQPIKNVFELSPELYKVVMDFGLPLKRTQRVEARLFTHNTVCNLLWVSTEVVPKDTLEKLLNSLFPVYYKELFIQKVFLNSVTQLGTNAAWNFYEK